jgi:hypothetical protein
VGRLHKNVSERGMPVPAGGDWAPVRSWGLVKNFDRVGRLGVIGHLEGQFELMLSMLGILLGHYTCQHQIYSQCA